MHFGRISSSVLGVELEWIGQSFSMLGFKLCFFNPNSI